ncbi:MAG: Mur ligase family protein, partial [bacterium]
LSELGAHIYIGHKAEQVGEASCIVYSSAIKPDNVELQEARRRKIPLISRAEMLAELMRMKTSIAIAGTHGKTTTTSLIATLLNSDSHLQPTAIIGGRLRSIRSGVIQGEGEILVAEADEFDQSFLKLHPTYVVITNIDNDHLECYGSFDELKRAFLQFTSNVPFWGKAILCMEDPPLQDLIPVINRPLITYGLSPQADIQAADIQFENRATR